MPLFRKIQAAPNSALACHVVHRGYRRRAVFHEVSDWEHYLGELAKGLETTGLSLLAYCMMRNHVHLVIAPDAEDRIRRLVADLHGNYANYYASCYESGAPVWCPSWMRQPLDYMGLWTIARYVELNPVRAGLIGAAQDYRYSSAAAHVDGWDPYDVLDLEGWRALFEGEDWRNELERWAREGRTFQRPLFRGRHVCKIPFEHSL